MAIWNDILSEQDKQMFSKAKMGGTRGLAAGSKPALLIVDMTYGFVDSKFRLGHSESGYSAVHATASVLAKAREKQIPVFYSRGFTENYESGLGIWKGSEPKSEEENTIVEEIKPLDHEVVLHKRRPSAFFGTSLVDMLIYHKVDSLIITGISTSGCVRASVVDAFSYNYKIMIPEEACGDRSQLSNKVSLMDMHMKYADVLKTKDIIAWMDQNL